MKSLSNYSCSQAVLLIVPLVLCLGDSTMAEASGADDPLFVGSDRLNTPRYRARAAEADHTRVRPENLRVCGNKTAASR
jgi:hypothetical protein